MPSQLAPIGIMVALKPVPFARHIGARHHARMALRLELAKPIRALMAFGERDQVARDELRLIIGEAPDAAVGLNEAHGEKIVELGMEDVEIEEGTPVGVEEEIVVEEM